MFRKTKAFLSLITAAVMLTSCSLGGGSSSSSSESSLSDDSSTTTTRATVTLPQDNTSVSDEGSQPDEQTHEDITPLMWKVTSGDGHEMTLIGTMHALSDDCYPLPDRITERYNAAEVVACEMDLYAFSKDLTTQLNLTNQALYSDSGETIAQHLSAETVDGLTAFLEKADGAGTMDKYKKYKPWMLLTVCETYVVRALGLDPYKGLDITLSTQAHEDGKEVYEVEGADYQFDMLMNFSDELYDLLLGGYNGDSYEAVVENNREMYAAWKSGDIETVTQLVTGEFDAESKGFENDEQKKLFEKYAKEMFYDRNTGMADAAEKLLKEHNNTFFMVGLAHFLNEGGIIDLLQKKGYTVEQI